MGIGSSLAGPRLRAAADVPSERRVPGEVGTWVFIVGDMTVFAFVFATYLVARAADTELFTAGQGGACFWHMVDLLWIVLLPLLYLVR